MIYKKGRSGCQEERVYEADSKRATDVNKDTSLTEKNNKAERSLNAGLKRGSKVNKGFSSAVLLVCLPYFMHERIVKTIVVVDALRPDSAGEQAKNETYRYQC